MMNNKGSILIMTLTFVFVFALLGVGTIYHATCQNEDTEKLRASMQAFWLADSGVEYVRHNVNITPVAISNQESLGQGSYQVSSQVKLTDPYGTPTAFDVISLGTVNADGPRRRKIRAEVGKAEAYIDKVLKTRGPIKNYEPPPEDAEDPDDPEVCDPPSSVDWICSEVEPNADFSLDGTFNMTLQEFYDTDHHEYVDPSPSDIAIEDLDDLVIIKLVDNFSVQLPNRQIEGAGFVLIDTTSYTGKHVPTISIEGTGNCPEGEEENCGNFSGILYIIGEAKIAGNPYIRGAAFIEGSPLEVTPVTGTPTFRFDIDAVHDALEDIPGGPGSGSKEFKLHVWEEMPC